MVTFVYYFSALTLAWLVGEAVFAVVSWLKEVTA